MNLVNATNLVAGYTMAVRPDGRELLLVVAKGTFAIPSRGEPIRLLAEQEPLVAADVFTGEPGFSAPLYENDFGAHKPKCDVLLNGSAHALRGQPTTRMTVSLRIGSWRKSFDVVGNRVWKKSLRSVISSDPEPFVALPISYNCAYGGVDKGADENQPDAYFLENHVGVGFHPKSTVDRIHGKPLPNTEETGQAISQPSGQYRPMSLGPLGRAWKQRIQYAGTYDQHWLDNCYPFLPTDFRNEYYQAAPADQWIDYPQGGEEVELIGLTPAGRTTFALPTMRVPCSFFRKNGERVNMAGTVDTLVFEPDQGRFMMSWRCALPLKKNIHEMRMVVVGTKRRGWYEDEGLIPPRSIGKRRFKSLDEMIQATRQT